MDVPDLQVLPTALAFILSIVSPLIAAFFTKVTMSSKAKNLVALAVSVVIGAGWVFLNGGFNGVDIVLALGSVYGIQQLVYNQLLKDVSKNVEANVGVKASDTDIAEDEFGE